MFCEIMEKGSDEKTWEVHAGLWTIMLLILFIFSIGQCSGSIEISAEKGRNKEIE